jgi:hypothetical protein
VSGNRPTEQLVDELARALEPVRPLPSLRRQALALAGAWALSAGLAAVWIGVRPHANLGRGSESDVLAAVLALLGASGLAAGVASRVPGRERLALAAAALVAAGIGIVAALCLSESGPLVETASFAADLGCIRHALLLGIPTGLLAAALAIRGAPWRSLRAAVALAIGAAAAGALLVHLCCPSLEPRHWLLAHALAPLFAGALAGVAFAQILDWLGRRRRGDGPQGGPSRSE